MLALLKQDRVFRNETMDATHLAEFHQVEGLVADVGLGIGDLKGIIHAFFLKIGISKLRFKPAFNPYTEPSMEIFGYQPELKKWIEIGNSGECHFFWDVLFVCGGKVCSVGKMVSPLIAIFC